MYERAHRYLGSCHILSVAVYARRHGPEYVPPIFDAPRRSLQQCIVALHAWQHGVFGLFYGYVQGL